MVKQKQPNADDLSPKDTALYVKLKALVDSLDADDKGMALGGLFSLLATGTELEYADAMVARLTAYHVTVCADLTDMCVDTVLLDFMLMVREALHRAADAAQMTAMLDDLPAEGGH